jgi:glycosyltransferase involved in cell wall biosynthesis|tara:strand:+ start:3058 stop:3927 length:870 start_codon:yes stop_codon:yes gene_type:complete
MTAERPPLVSVVIPTYNYAHYLGDAIKSVLDQSYSTLEVIVVDNYSTDNTRELVESIKDKRVRFLRFQNGGSIAAARNYGWRKSNGTLVAFLDADDKWLPDKLAKQVPCHFPISNTISHHNLRFFGSRSNGKTSGRKLSTVSLLDLLTRGNALATSSVIVSRSLLESSKGFSEEAEIVSAEDFELWLRLAEKGANFRFLRKTLGSYRIHAGSSSYGRSALAAEKVVDAYRSKLRPKESEKLDGWLAYAHAVSNSSGAHRIPLLLKAVRRASFRFKWRAVLRISGSLFLR